MWFTCSIRMRDNVWTLMSVQQYISPNIPGGYHGKYLSEENLSSVLPLRT